MLNLEIAPGERIGPFALRLTEDQLAATCRSIAGYRVHARGRTSQRGHTLTISACSLRLDSMGKA